MASRYDYMKDSLVVDPEDGENYPDPLNFNINKLNLYNIPSKIKLSQQDINRMWIFMVNRYGTSEG